MEGGDGPGVAHLGGFDFPSEPSDALLNLNNAGETTPPHAPFKRQRRKELNVGSPIPFALDSCSDGGVCGDGWVAGG